MGYAAGILNHKVTIAKRTKAEAGNFGYDSAGITYQVVGTYSGGFSWNKGQKAMREGAMDAYDIVMFRFHAYVPVDRWCLLKCNGVWYQIESLNTDHQDNQTQITAREMVNQDVKLVEPEPSSSEI